MRTFTIANQQTGEDTYRAHLIESFAAISGETFIDLGCNEGYESLALARRGAKRIVAVDGRDHYVAVTAERARQAGFSSIEASVADVRKIDEYDFGRFDHVLCFGLLYHMSNPLNLLRRLRNLCRKRLFLETHVGPLKKEGLLPKHQRYLSNDMTSISMEGELYEGRVWLSEAPNIKRTTGSLDEQRTYWVTVPSLKRMLERAGFRIHEFLYDSIPASYQPWANATNLGHANTKIFAVCDVLDPETFIPVVNYELERPVLHVPAIESWRTRVRKVTNEMKQRLGWPSLKKFFFSR